MIETVLCSWRTPKGRDTPSCGCKDTPKVLGVWMLLRPWVQRNPKGSGCLDTLTALGAEMFLLGHWVLRCPKGPGYEMRQWTWAHSKGPVNADKPKALKPLWTRTLQRSWMLGHSNSPGCYLATSAHWDQVPLTHCCLCWV